MLSESTTSSSMGNTTVNAKQCFREVLETLKDIIPIQMAGRYNLDDLYGTVIGLASNRQSIHSIQSTTENCPAENTIHHHLKKIDIETLQNLNPQILTHSVMDILQDIDEAIFIVDTSDDPYYGTVTDLNRDYVVGGKCKKSTNWFYRYATLYLVHNDICLTVGAIPICKDEEKLDCLIKLLTIPDQLGIDIKVLLIDRGFWSSSVFYYLQDEEIAHIMPVKKHGKELKALLKGRRSRTFTYRMGGKQPVELTVVVKVKYLMGKKNKKGVPQHGRKNLGYVVHGLDWSPAKVHRIYKRRFGVESSYRIRNLVRPRTTTRNPTIRYFYALVSLLLKNVWVAFSWRYFCPLRRGPRRILQDAFRFSQFVSFLWHAVTRRFGFRHMLKALRPVG